MWMGQLLLAYSCFWLEACAHALLCCVGFGLAMWALGAVFTGVSFNYGWLLFARIFTGAGMFSQPVSHVISTALSCLPEDEQPARLHTHASPSSSFVLQLCRPSCQSKSGEGPAATISWWLQARHQS